MNETVESIAKNHASQSYAEALDLLRRLARVGAPSGHEEKRAALVRGWLLSQGADAGALEVDGAGNVVLRLAGADRSACEVFCAHMDVVAPDEGELPFAEDERRMYAPGVGDDTANLVALLMAARWLLANGPQLKHDVLIVANTCEEGLGNLAGTRRLMAGLAEAGGRVAGFTSFDLYLGQHVTVPVGSERWRARVRTPGGHSWEDAGAPSAIEVMARLICGLYDAGASCGAEAAGPQGAGAAGTQPHDAGTQPPCAKTTVNAGTICGGAGVNSIAAECEALLEYRSTSQAALAHMRRELEALAGRLRDEGVEVGLELLGERPAAGPQEPAGQEALVSATDELIAALTGVEPRRQASSTDANVPLSMGIPAQTVGAVSGALLHTRDEWIEKASLKPGLALALGLILTRCAEL